MITDIMQYTLHIAPSLAIMMVLIVWQYQQSREMITRIENMLENCMNKLMDLIDSDDTNGTG